MGVPIEEGSVIFAAAGPGTRKTTLCLFLGDFPQLGQSPWETPIGKVCPESMHILHSLFTGYGDIPQCGGTGPDPLKLEELGNEYLEANFPECDYIIGAARVLRRMGDCWLECVDTQGRYFYNQQTHEAVDTLPAELDATILGSATAPLHLNAHKARSQEVLSLRCEGEQQLSQLSLQMQASQQPRHMPPELHHQQRQQLQEQVQPWPLQQWQQQHVQTQQLPQHEQQHPLPQQMPQSPSQSHFHPHQAQHRPQPMQHLQLQQVPHQQQQQQLLLRRATQPQGNCQPQLHVQQQQQQQLFRPPQQQQPHAPPAPVQQPQQAMFLLHKAPGALLSPRGCSPGSPCEEWRGRPPLLSPGPGPQQWLDGLRPRALSPPGQLAAPYPPRQLCS